MTINPGEAPPPAGKKGFQPTDELVRAAETVFLAMAMEGTVRPVVEKYQQAILATHQFSIDTKWREIDTEEKILSPKLAYLLSDADAKVYFRECHAAREASGLKVSRAGNCPLLEAEEDVRKAQNAFIAELGNIPGLEAIAANSAMTLEQRAQLIDLGLKLVAPFVSNADKLLQRVMATHQPTA